MFAVTQRHLVRTAAALLVAGEGLHIVAGFFHAGDGSRANQHAVIFNEYAASDVWIAAHVGFFAAGLLTVGGLILLCRALARAGAGEVLPLLSGVGAVMIAAAEGLVLAVDGVALKQAVDAWVSADGPAKAAAFQDAETVRWLEWGALTFLSLAQGLTLVLLGFAVRMSQILPRFLGWVVVATGLCYLASGVIVGHEGFSDTLSPIGVASYVLTLIVVLAIAYSAWRGTEAGMAEAPSST